MRRWETAKLIVQVRDVNATGEVQEDRAVQVIRLLDVNDNRPRFDQAVYRGRVTENAPIGTFVLATRASDLDVNRTLRYALEGASDELLRLLQVQSNTGEVRVQGRIDREMHSWINVSIRATDSGQPPLSGVAQIRLQVLDENDNNPVFLNSYAGEHARLALRNVTARLDSIADAGQETSSGSVEVLSVNENTPIGSKLIQLRAIDADQGEFGRLTYLLDTASSDGVFTLDKQSGWLRLSAPLDREHKAEYELLVQVLDNYELGFTNGDSRRAFKRLHVHVIDVNDHAPRLLLASTDGCLTVSELAEAGQVVGQLNAIDLDQPGTGNSMVVFTLLDNRDFFGLTELPSTSLSSTLDSNEAQRLLLSNRTQLSRSQLVSVGTLRGRVGNYTVRIRLSDRGQPSLSSEERLTVCVLDVNDHAPRFLFPPLNHTLRVPENATVGHELLRVRADDSDHGMNAIVRYRLRALANRHSSTFEIDSISGSLRLRAPLDRARQKTYNLRIEAFDQGSPSSLSSDLDLHVRVISTTERNPQFTADQQIIHFEENKEAGLEKFRLLDTIDSDDDLANLDATNNDRAFDRPLPCYYLVGK